MYRIGNRLRLLALTVLGLLAIPPYYAQAQTMRREPNIVRTQFVKAADTVDPSTLTGKLIMGYQGWFNCPNDGTSVGWWHWFTGVDPTVDFLPNAADYPTAEQCVTTMLDAGGNPVNLFSDANPATVETQFAWMQQYGLDGVALQRFSVDLLDKATLDARNIVLANVRQAAEDNGRVFFVMYDLSGLPNSKLNTVAQDWKKLESEGITSSPAYLHHRGHPLLAVWGLGFAGRSLTPSDTLKLLKSLHKASAKAWRRDNHGRRAVVLAHGAPRCVLRSRLEEGLAQARRAEPLVGRPFLRRNVGRRLQRQRMGAGSGGHARDGRGLPARGVPRLFLREHEPCTGTNADANQPDSARLRPLLLAAGV